MCEANTTQPRLIDIEMAKIAGFSRDGALSARSRVDALLSYVTYANNLIGMTAEDVKAALSEITGLIADMPETGNSSPQSPAENPADEDPTRVTVVLPALTGGARGYATTLVKMLLCINGFSNDPEDPTLFDASTVEALKAFQSARGLKVTGSMDKDTWENLLVGN